MAEQSHGKVVGWRMNISASTATDSFQHSFFGGFQFVCCAWHCDPKLVTHTHSARTFIKKRIWLPRAHRTRSSSRSSQARCPSRPSVRPSSFRAHPFSAGKPWSIAHFTHRHDHRTQLHREMGTQVAVFFLWQRRRLYERELGSCSLANQIERERVGDRH